MTFETEYLDALLTDEALAIIERRISSSLACGPADLSMLAHALRRIEAPQTRAAACLLDRLAELLESNGKFREGALPTGPAVSVKIPTAAPTP